MKLNSFKADAILSHFQHVWPVVNPQDWQFSINENNVVSAIPCEIKSMKHNVPCLNIEEEFSFIEVIDMIFDYVRFQVLLMKSCTIKQKMLYGVSL